MHGMDQNHKLEILKMPLYVLNRPMEFGNIVIQEKCALWRGCEVTMINVAL